MNTAQWQIGELKLKPDLVWTMALSSLRIRITRTFLTVLTITTSTAFLMYLLTMPRKGDPTEQQSWYLMMGLSLVVSTAGVLNTMLMSVTQRYREIGTMKCLGALDSFVLYSVMLEAAILGLCGALMGLFCGVIISFGLGLVEHGGNLMKHMQFDGMTWKVPLVFLVGMFLTTIGAFVPALIASKMPPMDAMRGEK